MDLLDAYLLPWTRGSALGLAFWTLSHVAPLFVLLVGRRFERAFALVYLAYVLVSFSTLAEAGIDVLLAASVVQSLAVLTVAVLPRAPAWTLFAAAFQLVQTLVYFLMAAGGEPVRTFAVYSLVIGFEYLFMTAMAVGAWQSRRHPTHGAGPHPLTSPAT